VETCCTSAPTTGPIIGEPGLPCIFTWEAKQANIGVAEGFEQVLTRLTGAGLLLD